jgi:hypothetical protein
MDEGGELLLRLTYDDRCAHDVDHCGADEEKFGVDIKADQS